MLTISNLDYRIGARSLFENASAQISSGWKVGLVGRNGTGKSTLLKLIREEIDQPSPDAAIRLVKGARMGWVAQEASASPCSSSVSAWSSAGPASSPGLTTTTPSSLL